MKRYLYMLVLLLVFIPAAGQKNQSWRYNCQSECARKNNECLKEANGDGPKKAVCEKNYRACRYWCENPPKKA